MCIKTEFRKGNRNGGINLQYLAFQLRDAGRSESIISQTASIMGHKYKIPCRFHFLQNMNKNKNPSKKKEFSIFQSVKDRRGENSFENEM